MQESLCRVVGNRTYGSKYHDQIVDTVRRSAESCDHLQSFFMMHSMGGGVKAWYTCYHGDPGTCTRRDGVRSWYSHIGDFER